MFFLCQAYTIEGDQVLAGGRYYSNKSRSQGIVRASVRESLAYEQNKREGIAQHFRSAEEEDRQINRKLNDGKVGVLYWYDRTCITVVVLLL